MTTYLTPSSISAIPDDGKPTADQYAYFSRSFLNELHGEVLRCFIEENKEGLTKAELARRLEKDPAQITRFFGAPKNATIETISNYFLAMGRIPAIRTFKVQDAEKSNEHHPLANQLPPPPSTTGNSWATVVVQ